MLKHFQVPDDIAVRVDVDKLRSVTEQVFMKCGVPESEAKQGADVLIFADQSGIDTHGVSNMLRSYVAGYNSDVLNPNPEMKTIKETPSTATIDGDGGLGEDIKDVITVDHNSGDAVAGSATGDPVAGVGVGYVGAHTPLVVFADVDDGQVVQGAKVDAFVECAVWSGTVTEKADGYLVFAAKLAAEGRPDRKSVV